MRPLFKKVTSLSRKNSEEEREINQNLFLNHFSVQNSATDAKCNLEDYFNKMFKSNIKKNEKLKKILRNPELCVSSSSRVLMWLSLMGGVDQDESPTCSEFDNFDVESENLPLFVNQKFETSYFLNDKGRGDVRRIMFYFAYINPTFSYCPLLYYMSTVFLHYFDPSVSVTILQNMLEKSDFFGIGFSHSTKDKLARVHKYFCSKFSKTGFDLCPHHTSDWIPCLFYLLPFAYLVRILDCYAMEGIKVIIRFGVAVAHYIGKTAGLQKKETCNSNHVSDYETWRTVFSAKNVTMNKLFRKAFKMAISRGKIDQLMKTLVKGDSFVSYSSLKSSDSTIVPLQERLNFYYITELTPINSWILDQHQLRVIWSWLPFRMLTKDPELIFTTREHGWSLKTFYSKCAHWENVIVAYEVITGEKFGFFSPVELNVTHDSSRYYGTGETFVFTVHPTLKNYPWVGIAKHGHTDCSEEMFIAGDISLLIVGGGGGEAIFIQEDLFEGRSEHCDTFDNDPLVIGSEFVCKIVEVVGLR